MISVARPGGSPLDYDAIVELLDAAAAAGGLVPGDETQYDAMAGYTTDDLDLATQNPTASRSNGHVQRLDEWLRRRNEKLEHARIEAKAQREVDPECTFSPTRFMPSVRRGIIIGQHFNTLALRRGGLHCRLWLGYSLPRLVILEETPIHLFVCYPRACVYMLYPFLTVQRLTYRPPAAASSAAEKPVVDRLTEWETRRLARMAYRVDEKAAGELDGCTFAPLLVARGGGGGGSSRGGASEAAAAAAGATPPASSASGSIGGPRSPGGGAAGAAAGTGASPAMSAAAAAADVAAFVARMTVARERAETHRAALDRVGLPRTTGGGSASPRPLSAAAVRTPTTSSRPTTAASGLFASPARGTPIYNADRASRADGGDPTAPTSRGGGGGAAAVSPANSNNWRHTFAVAPVSASTSSSGRGPVKSTGAAAALSFHSTAALTSEHRLAAAGDGSPVRSAGGTRDARNNSRGSTAQRRAAALSVLSAPPTRPRQQLQHGGDGSGSPRGGGSLEYHPQQHTLPQALVVTEPVAHQHHYKPPPPPQHPHPSFPMPPPTPAYPQSPAAGGGEVRYWATSGGGSDGGSAGHFTTVRSPSTAGGGPFAASTAQSAHEHEAAPPSSPSSSSRIVSSRQAGLLLPPGEPQQSHLVPSAPSPSTTAYLIKGVPAGGSTSGLFFSPAGSSLRHGGADAASLAASVSVRDLYAHRY